nr:MAG TPA_asm: hypothetical protein [Bacteriophage sp.]
MSLSPSASFTFLSYSNSSFTFLMNLSSDLSAVLRASLCAVDSNLNCWYCFLSSSMIGLNYVRRFLISSGTSPSS